MKDDIKKFFEELSAAEKEYTPELAKAAAPITAKTTEEKEVEMHESGAMEVFDESEGQLTIDVYQTPTEIIIESTIAGVNPEDLDVAINNESVTIRGKREKAMKVSEEDYFYQECYWGRFSRSIILPQEVDADNAVASLKNGILSIHLPKLNRSRSKKIKVKLT